MKFIFVVLILVISIVTHAKFLEDPKFKGEFIQAYKIGDLQQSQKWTLERVTCSSINNEVKYYLI